jgi:hypothetical protein
MRSVEKIRSVNPALAQKIEQQGYCLRDTDVPEVQKVDRLMLVLVRCGCGRFLCPAQDLQHFIAIIEQHAKDHPNEGDYIRDVSLNQ